MQQRMERFFPWLATALLAGVPSVWLLWLAGQGLRSLYLATGLTVFFALPLALALCCVWLPRRHLPPPAPAFVPDPLYLPGSFALSTAQFFPVSDSYREDPPAPPKTPHTRTARMAATAFSSIQGICTRPQMGSQVRPRWCSMATSAAYSTWSRFCLYSSARAAAAMEQAVPISA